MNGNDAGGTQISPREILAVIFRRRVPIIVCALVVAAAALSAASRAKTVYDSTTKVLVRRTPASALTTTWTPYFQLEEEMNTEVEIVISEPVLERAVQILNEAGVSVVTTKKKHKTSRPPTTGDLAAGVSAEPLEQSNILLIKFRGADPNFVRAAANAMADAYVEYRVQVRKSAGLEEYFEDKITALEGKLLDLSRSELDLRIKGGIYDREWQQRITLNRQSEIELKLNETRGRRVGEEDKLAVLKARIAANPDIAWPFPLDPDDHLGQLLLTDYWTLRRDRDAAAAQFTPANPQVQLMDKRIAEMQGRFREETGRRLKDKEYLIQDLKATEAGYEKEIALVKADLVLDPEIVAQIDHRQKEIGYTYLHYDKVLEKMLDTMASEADDIRLSNAKVISPADVRLTKAGQMKSVYVVFSILLGVALGIGFGFLLESMDHSVRSASDVEDIVGVPLLGSIPDAGPDAEARSKMTRTHDPNS